MFLSKHRLTVQARSKKVILEITEKAFLILAGSLDEIGFLEIRTGDFQEISRCGLDFLVWLAEIFICEVVFGLVGCLEHLTIFGFVHGTLFLSGET